MATVGNPRAGFAKIMAAALSLVLVLSGVPGVALAQAVLSLKDVPAPEPPNLSDFIKDKQAAIALGKALFWDMQVGSDSVQACASCHSKAGADNRTKNQINPGLNAGDNVFGNASAVFAGFNPPVPGLPQLALNYQLKASDFPFHSRDPETAGTPRPPLPGAEFGNLERDCNDVVSSQGVRFAKFLGVIPGLSLDLGLPLADQVFHLSNFSGKDRNLRRVEPRNTPTMINAVFNAENFWDGRASMVFNGVNPFGFRDRTSTLKKNINGTLTDVSVRIPMGSLASQAVGPPVSDFEMSFQGRDFPSIGRKMVKLRPLALQLVHPQDSVLGTQSRAVLLAGRVVGQRGLKVAHYAEMIKQAFKDEWWNSADICSLQDGTQFVHTPERQNPRTFKVNLGKPLIKKFISGMALGDKDFTQMEYNFSLFFGLAVQLYQATLIADDTPWDRFVGSPLNVRGTELYPIGVPIPKDDNALTPTEQQGLALFNSLGCVLCHTLPETTEHTIRNLRVDNNGVPQNLLKFLPDGVGGGFGPPNTLAQAYIDFGMRNIAHRPSTEDLGRAGTAPNLPPFQNPLDSNNPLPLSYVELWKLKKAGKLPDDVKPYVPDTPTAVIPIPGTPLPVNDKSVTKGAFKVPNLRNGLLTGPYMHDGTYSTLRQVVQFYARGANFPDTNFNEIALGIVPISALNPADPLKSDAEKATAEANIKALVAFLAHGLADDRVIYQRDQFSHPELFIPNGALNSTPLIDQFIEIPPVGKFGTTAPLPTFLGLDPQTP
jgi:cytochrome c peroxidase